MGRSRLKAPCPDTMTNCLVVQHVAAESAWAIGDALERAGVTLDVRRAHDGDSVPVDTSDYDGLVVMGGPMSALSDDGFPSRRRELALLADAADLGKPTLGVCLGAQLLALATGGSVRRGESGPEVGWGQVVLTPRHDDDALLHGLPGQIEVLHWHGDTYEPPPAAVRLAENGRYRNQAFRVGDAAWGLQFHLEVTRRAVDEFLVAFGDEATSHASGGPDGIRRATPPALELLSPWQDVVFDRFAALVAAFGGRGSRDDFADISAP